MEINSMLVIIMLKGIKLHCIMLIQYYNFVVSINIIKCMNLYRFNHYYFTDKVHNTILLIRFVNYFTMGILARLRAD